MNVALLGWTPQPVRLMASAARLCYSKEGPCAAYHAMDDPDTARSLVIRCIEAGHGSVLEHVSFTFGIEGISRACSHQLVRHRLCAISQQSQRYVDLTDFEIVIPEAFTEIEENHPAWEERGPMARLQRVKLDAREHYAGIILAFETEGVRGEEAAQDARYVLPNATKTNLIWTTNFRNLIHVCSVRLCKRAQWEIRELFKSIVTTLGRLGELSDHRFLSQFLVPQCQALGYCTQGARSCGSMPLKAQVLEAWRAKETQT